MQIIEGSRFSHMRKVIDATPDIGHDTKGWSNEKLMAEVAPDAFSGNPEGQFFPDSYEIDAGGSDLQIYQTAYKAMQRRLNEAWAGRQDGLPYKNPYEMLIMASLIEKETGHGRPRPCRFRLRQPPENRYAPANRPVRDLRHGCGIQGQNP